MNRWKASGSHFLLSLLVIGSIATSAFLLWYPYALYRVAGLDRILLVMLGIDLTAGPLLTLIVYKPGKKSLKFDLAVIALCQMAFLAYGLHTLSASRPVFLVGTPDTFTLVFANEIDDADLAQAPRPEWRSLSWTGPVLVGTRMPDDAEQRHQIIEAFMAGGAGIERTPEHYLDFSEVAPALLKASAQPITGADQIDEADLRATKKTREQLRTAPIISRRGEGRMLVDTSSGQPLRTIARPRRGHEPSP